MCRNPTDYIEECLPILASGIAQSGRLLHSSSVSHLCNPGDQMQCRTVTRESDHFCLQQFRCAEGASAYLSKKHAAPSRYIHETETSDGAAKKACEGGLSMTYLIVSRFCLLAGSHVILCPCRSQAPFNGACRMELEAQQEWLRYREIQASGSSLSCCLSAVGDTHTNHALHSVSQSQATSLAQLSAHVLSRLRKHQAFHACLAWGLAPLQSSIAGPKCACGEVHKSSGKCMSQHWLQESALMG